MKIVWALLAILLGCLSLGGLMTGLSGRNGGGIFDIAIGALLGWAAWGVWKRGVLGGKARPASANEPDRPWRR
jgi:hypothetical protein